MTITLIQEVTEKDRVDFIKVHIRRILCLPFSPIIFADARYWVEQLNGDIRKEFDSLIWRWFYEHGYRGSGFKSENSKLSGRKREEKTAEKA